MVYGSWDIFLDKCQTNIPRLEHNFITVCFARCRPSLPPWSLSSPMLLGQHGQQQALPGHNCAAAVKVIASQSTCELLSKLCTMLSEL